MSTPVPLRRFHLVTAELSVVVSALLVLAVLGYSTNGSGHRIKAAVLLAGGLLFFLLAVARIRGWAEARDAGPAPSGTWWHARQWPLSRCRKAGGGATPCAAVGRAATASAAAMMESAILIS